MKMYKLLPQLVLILTIVFSSFSANCNNHVNQESANNALAANQYYFSSLNGNDANTGGSPSQAWKSIKKLNDLIPQLQPGDVVLFERGSVWYESQVNIHNVKGNVFGKITFKTYGSGKNPVISGAKNLSGTFSQKDNLWIVNNIDYSVKDYIRVPSGLLINDQFQAISRHPNDSYYNTKSTGKTSLHDGSQSWKNNELVDGMVVARCVAYSWEIGTITSNDAQNINFTEFKQFHLNQDGYGSTSYYLQNVDHAVDLNGEWMYKNGQLKVKYNGNLNSQRVEFPVQDTVVSVLSSDYIEFDGITFQHANAIAVNIEKGENVTFKNCTVRVAGFTGMKIHRVNNLELHNNHFEYLHANGIMLNNTGGGYIENNTFLKTPGVRGHNNENDRWVSAITNYYTEKAVYIRNNHFDSVAIAYQSHWSNDSWYFEKNLITNYGIICGGDIGAIYNGGDWRDNVPKYVRKNIFINSNSQREILKGSHPTRFAHGIYWDYDSRGVEVDSNTFINTNVALYSNQNHSNKFRYNTIVNGAKDMNDQWSSVILLDGSSDGTTQIDNHNISHNTIVFGDNAYETAFLWHSGPPNNLLGTNFNIDHNIYQDPFSNDHDIHRTVENYFRNSNNYSMSEYCSKTGYDCNSRLQPLNWVFSNTSDITKEEFVHVAYNASNENRDIPLSANYIDMEGNMHEHHISLEPYGSKILFYHSKSDNVKKNTPPVMNDQTFHVVIDNNIASFIGKIQAKNNESNQTLEFQISSGNENGLFSLNKNGNLSFNPSKIGEIQQTATYTLQITVKDNGTPSLSDIANITINCTKEAEPVNTAPSIQNQQFSVLVNENTNSFIGKIKAQDIDVEQSLTFTINSGNENNIFNLNSNGDLNFNTSKISDIKNTTTYKLSVSVQDNGTPPMEADAIITVHCTYESKAINNVPVIQNQQFTVYENQITNNLIGKVIASDEDAGQKLKYSIISGNDDNIFSINNQGEVFFNNNINFTNDPIHNVVVRVTDDGVPVLSADANITIQLIANKITLFYPSDFIVKDKNYNQLSLSWNLLDIKDVSYEIEKTHVKYNTVTTVTIDSNTSSYVDQDILPDNEYKYRIRAFYEDKYSEYSEYLTVTSLVHPYSLTSGPKITGYQITEHAVEINWNFDGELDHFEIQRSTDDTLNFFTVSAVNKEIRHFEDTVSFTDTYIYYRLKSVKDGISSQYSKSFKTINPNVYRNEKLVLSFDLPSYDTVDLHWNKISAESVNIQRNINGGPYKTISSVKNQSFNDWITGDYKVVKYRLIGNYTSNLEKISNEVTIDASYFASQLNLNLEKIYSTRVDVTWNDQFIPQQSNVQIYRSIDNNAFEKVNSVIDRVVYNDNTVSENTRYYYYIAYSISNQLRIVSDTLEITTDKKPEVGIPVLAKIELQEFSNAMLNWNVDTHSYASYDIERSMNDTASFHAIKTNVSSGIFTDNKLEEGMHYFYRIKLSVENNFVAHSNIQTVYVPMSSEYNRSTEGLIASYNFNSNPDNVYDISNYLTPVNLKQNNSGNSNKKSGQKAHRTYISAEPVSKILNSVKASGEYSLECWVKSSEWSNESFQQIISIENEKGKLFSISQDNLSSKGLFNYMVNFRTNSTTDDGRPDFYLDNTFEFHSINHVVYTRDSAGNEKFFLNGNLVSENIRPSGLDDWMGEYYLVIGSTINGLHPWNGNIYYLSVYNKTLDEMVIAQHYDAGAYPNFHLETKSHKVEVYPNPAINDVSVKIVPKEEFLSGEKTQLMIMNSMGQILETHIIPDPSLINEFEIDLSGYDSGMYYVIVKSNSQLQTKKFVINRNNP